MNTKLRNDSTFAQLTSEQIEMLEDWLFEDKLGYREVVAKMQQELGVKTSQTALGRFFRRLADERAQEVQMETIAAYLATLANVKGDGTLQAGLFALANIQAAQLLLKPMASVKEFTGLLRAMTSAQGMEMKRAEAQRVEDKRKERLLEDARLKEVEQLRWDEERFYREERNQKRKATIAAKKAAAEAKAKAEQDAMTGDQGQMPKNPEPLGDGTPRVVQFEQVIAQSECRPAAGLPAAECSDEVTTSSSARANGADVLVPFEVRKAP